MEVWGIGENFFLLMVPFVNDEGNYYIHPKFGKAAREHPRFFRNFLSHFRKYYFDPLKKRRCCYASDWNEMYVEFQLSEIRTNFVVELFEMVYSMADTDLSGVFLFIIFKCMYIEFKLV